MDQDRPEPKPRRRAPIVSAAELSRKGTRAGRVAEVIDDTLRAVHEALTAAPVTWGRNVYTYRLPAVFGIDGLATKEQQKLVYSAIIADLQRNGFEVGLELGDGGVNALHIAWMSDLRTEEVQAMDALIGSVLLPSADAVRAFHAGRLSHAPDAASLAPPPRPAELRGRPEITARAGARYPAEAGAAARDEFADILANI